MDGLLAFLGGTVDVFHEAHLDEWALWRQSTGRGWRLIAGTERWHQLIWLTVRHTVLETDPGPLDAHVP